MKIPKRLQPLVDDGLVDEVVRQMMSGKEATVYMVRSGGELRCAKVYKEADKRSFKKAVQYQEGRKVRSGRRARAMEKGTRYGREQQEETWQNAEVSALYRLAAAGVRVPEPFGCVDGVLLMELVTDADGDVAPRLSEITMPSHQAITDHGLLMREVVRMLCAGLVHGDLSEFNVLQDASGPVIIDLPQAVDASANNHAEFMLERDVQKITEYYAQFAPELLETRFGKEIWALYEAGDLHPDVPLSGYFAEDLQKADVAEVLDVISYALSEEEERQQRRRDAEDSD
ncbi:PA4780 family RIO1-like protein kinase [Porticoccus hydrocarbonoclasticus]|jgi:RIO kinase 1|uniref:PA4780 family RIO1-like protein kinase n=1 Tax=Porticoccus hydrocarbonoclasticus TaxID=1073414 RepID=UPI00056036B4|nr:PA4780 family RIO1-like protein kinase [Porticoccus hydrocarbonoclasticus]|tara:strand:+ start:1072 stop:1929 length:858 start_codon:yes stop_codon:yes gene_type:complete